MPAIYSNNRSGTLSADPGSGGTTLNSAAFASLDVVASPNSMWLVLDPEGVNGAPEIVNITTHTSLATSCTVTRAQQSTSARAHPIGTVWVVAVTKSDLDELPFRKMTTRGDLLYASAANTASRLAIGAANTVFKSDGTDPSWGTIATANIADGAVTSAKIADGTIATGDIADGAVTSAKIADGTIATGDIADGAVTAAKQASSLPRGYVTASSVTSRTSGLTGTAVDVTTVTFTQTSGRRYRLSLNTMLGSSVAADIVAAYITDNSNNILAVAQATVSSAGVAESVMTQYMYVAGSSGSVTFKVRAIRPVGSGNAFFDGASTFPAHFIVEDIGA